MKKNIKKTVKNKKTFSPHFIFVVGGVMSGVGKGIATASIGKLLQARGYSVTAFKIDPYINVDAGTMNPTEHGEVFVLSDGDECDQDMGNYERFLNTTLSKENYMTTGRVYQKVIEKERNLGYKGKCVQVVPHIPEAVLSQIKETTKKAGAEIAVIEIGGTVGEYENILFIEAVRMMQRERPEKTLVVMVSYLPVPKTVGEMKTKPTQHAIRTLNSTGVHPDFILARSTHSLDKKRKEKLSLFCGVEEKHIISAPDVESIYDIPLHFEKESFSEKILDALTLPQRKINLQKWNAFAKKVHKKEEKVSLAVVGKYFDSGDFVLSDAYISVLEALKYSAASFDFYADIAWLDAKDFEKTTKNLKTLNEYDGILIPGGFGETGIEGKINVVRYARENKIPLFGICYGMQIMTIEYARTFLSLFNAHTTEINKNTPYPVIDILPEQKKNVKEKKYGGSMRLGAYTTHIEKNSYAYSLYKKESVEERHRHRYEVNPDYIEKLKEEGLVFSGKSPGGSLMEIVELPKNTHPFFIGTQFHPEFTSRPLSPHPLFTGFVKASIEKKREKEGEK